MVVNVRKTTVVVSESVALAWLKAADPETLKNQNIDLAYVIVYEDGTPVEDVLKLIVEAKA